MAKAKTKPASPVDGLGMKILALVLALLFVFGIGWSVLENTGITQRSVVTLKSEHYEVNNAMLSYYYKNEYANFLNQYGYYLSYFGLDTSKSLKEQKYYGGNMTWYEYFLKAAIDTATEQIILCEAALAAGKKIEEKEQKKIDETIASIKSTAKSYKMPLSQYLSGMYGTGVNMSDVEKCLEMSALASKQYTDMIESYEWDSEDYDKWAGDNKSSIWFVDYMSFPFKADFKKTDDDETKAAARKAAEDLAKALAEKKTEDEFFQWIVDYEKSLEAEKNNSQSGTGKAAETGDAETGDAETGETESGGKEEKPKYEKEDYTTTEFGFDTESDFGKWAFAEDRQALETTVIYDEDKETYTAYLMLKTNYRYEYKTVNIRHILLELSKTASKEKDAEVKAQAQAILDEFLAGDKTPEAFGALALKHTADGNGEQGGLYENVLKDQMVEAFNDWIFDEARQVGDTGLVKTDYGYHVMYFDGFGLEAWQVTAENGLTSEQYEEDYEALKKAHTVDLNVDNAYKLEG